MLTGAQFWDRESQSGWWGPNLKPYAVIVTGSGSIVGLALTGKALGVIPESDGAQAGLFPAEAGPTIDRMRSVRLVGPNFGTGFSREGVRCHTAYLMVFMRASSRLKPAPLMVSVHSVRLVQAS